MNMKHSVVVIDDNIEILNYLTDSINAMENFECINSYRTVQEFMDLKSSDAEFLILDLGLPNVERGLEAISLLKNKNNALEIIILTAYEDNDLIVKALTLGAMGYLFKSEVMTRLEEELNVLVDGGAALSPLVARKIINHFSPKPKTMSVLNRKEEDILKYLANGSTYDEVSELMDMKIDNVRYYVKSIYKKLHVNNKSSAIQKYFFGFF